jgi:hypothetical protein
MVAGMDRWTARKSLVPPQHMLDDEDAKWEAIYARRGRFARWLRTLFLSRRD